MVGFGCFELGTWGAGAVQKARCRSLVPDLRGLGGLGGWNMYNVVVSDRKILSLEGRDGVTCVGLGYQCDQDACYGFYMVVRAC